MDLTRFSRLVAFPHSVFALPFALSGFLLAARRGPTVELRHGRLTTLLLVVLCVVAARTAAMAFNRVVDARIDLANPRTKDREIPSGKVQPGAAWLLVVCSSIVFLTGAYLLGPHCFWLAPFVLAVLLGYSYMKRISPAAHLVLGLALALAPGGAWWVLRPEIALLPILLMLSVLFWVSGFDIIYSCQDVISDRENGIFSIPAKLGVDSSLQLSELFHFVCLFGFLAVGAVAGLGVIYFAGVILFGALLTYEHSLVSPGDLSKVNQAFFTVNGLISVLYLVAVAASI